MSNVLVISWHVAAMKTFTILVLYMK